MPNPLSFRYFKTSPEIIQLAVMLHVRFPLSLRNVEDLLHERGVDVSYEFVRYWWPRFGSQFASQIKTRRAGGCSPGVANKLTIAIGDAWRDEKRLPIKDYIYQKHNVLRNLCCAPH